MTGQTAYASSNTTIKEAILNSINNLKVNHNPFYEAAKNNTTFALNMLQDGIVSLAVVNLVFGLHSLLLTVAGGYIVYKTVKHGIAEFKRYTDEKEKIRKLNKEYRAKNNK